MADYLTPDARRRIAGGLMAAQYNRATPEEGNVAKRHGLLPLATYDNGQTGMSFPGFIAEPVQGIVNELYNPTRYVDRTDEEKRRTAENSFNVAGAAMLGGLAAPKPRGVVGSSGGDLRGAALGAIPDQAALMDRTRSRFGSAPPRDPFANPESGQPFTGAGWHGSPDNQLAVDGAVNRSDPSAYISPHGPWITNNRDVASTYTRVEPEAPIFSGSNVMPMEARFRNPMVYDAQGRPGGEAYIAPGNVAWDTNDISGVAKQRGHDGLVVRNVRDELQGGGAVSDVYHPLQRGTVYSPTTGDLLYANGGRPGAAAGAALGAIPDAPGVRAYHGSPHDFDKFDLSKIGTGEGAQAYGHGLYFAENEGVAKSYRDALGGQRFADGSKFDDANAAHQASAYVAGTKSKNEAISAINEDIAMSRRQMDEKHAQILLRARGLLERDGPIPKLDQGNMYEVNIKANPDDFLDWDKPLSQQSEKVRAALAGNGYFRDDRKISESMRLLASDYGGKYGGEETASQKLADAGIAGVRYLDQGSRAAGDGSRNYVVFDDKLIEILRKYGLLGMAGGAAAAEYGGNSLMPSRPASPQYRPGDA